MIQTHSHLFPGDAAGPPATRGVAVIANCRPDLAQGRRRFGNALPTRACPTGPRPGRRRQAPSETPRKTGKASILCKSILCKLTARNRR